MLHRHLLGLIASQPQPFSTACSWMHDGDLVEVGRGEGNWYSSALCRGCLQQQGAMVLQLSCWSGTCSNGDGREDVGSLEK